MELMKEYKSKWHMIFLFLSFSTRDLENIEKTLENININATISISFGNIVALLFIPTAPFKSVTLHASDSQVRKSQNLIGFFTYFQISNNINITTVVYAEISQQHLNKIALNYVQLCLSNQLFTTNK